MGCEAPGPGQRPAPVYRVRVTSGTQPNLWDLAGRPPDGSRGTVVTDSSRHLALQARREAPRKGGGAQVTRPEGAAPVHSVTPRGRGCRNCPRLHQPVGPRGSPVLTAEPMHGAPRGREGLLGRKHLPIHHENWKCELTSVDKPPRSTFTELLGFVGQGDFDDSRNVPRWGLDSDGVGSDQL